jgi:hypothetical protein
MRALLIPTGARALREGSRGLRLQRQTGVFAPRGIAAGCADSQTRRVGRESEGWWACLDLNQGPSGYEPVALTN